MDRSVLQGTSIVAQFQETGPLGITFSVMTVSDNIVIQEIETGSQAEKIPNIRTGLILQSINNTDVGKMADTNEVIQALQARPVKLAFLDPTPAVEDPWDTYDEGAWVPERAAAGSPSVSTADKARATRAAVAEARRPAAQDDDEPVRGLPGDRGVMPEMLDFLDTSDADPAHHADDAATPVVTQKPKRKGPRPPSDPPPPDDAATQKPKRKGPRPPSDPPPSR